MVIPRRDKHDRRIRRQRIHHRIFVYEVTGIPFDAITPPSGNKPRRLPWIFEAVEKIAFSLLHVYLNYLATDLVKPLRAIRPSLVPRHRRKQNQILFHLLLPVLIFSNRLSPFTHKPAQSRAHPSSARTWPRCSEICDDLGTSKNLISH